MIAWTPEDEAAEQKRLATLADALGCKPDEVTPARLQAEADKIGGSWHEVTAEKLTAARIAKP